MKYATFTLLLLSFLLHSMACDSSEEEPGLQSTPEDSNEGDKEKKEADGAPELPACAQIVAACHHKDDGKSDFVSECHERGHDEETTACEENLEPCLRACAEGQRAFALRFAAVANGEEIGCADTISSLGPGEDISLGISDFRFYVSNLRLWDDEGNELPSILEQDEFQYSSQEGQVSLIDLTSNTEGSCVGNAVAFAEGTSRTNETIRGVAEVDKVVRVSFDLGIPQSLMQAVISAETVESAPSPMNEMFWSWASGYRHFVMNALLTQGDETGEGYLHIGSRDCSADGELALENRDSCGLVNTAQVALAIEDLEADSIAVNIAAIVEGLDFRAPIYNPETFEVIGESLGLECHSAPTQPHCAEVFDAFGIDAATGEANAAENKVFSIFRP